MKIKTLMVICAVITAVFGLAFVILPERFLLLYGTPDPAPLKYLGQLFGAALITFAVLTWSARNSPDNEARKAIVFSLFAGNAVGFVAALMGQLGGAVNELGWSTTAIYFLLSAGFGYFHFTKPAS